MEQFKRNVVVSILLLVARMYATEEWRVEIKNLATHISVWDRAEA